MRLLKKEKDRQAIPHVVDARRGWQWDGRLWQPPEGVEPGWSRSGNERARQQATEEARVRQSA